MNLLYIGELNEFGAKICNYLSRNADVSAISLSKGQYELECDYYPYSQPHILENVIKQKKIDTLIFFFDDQYRIENVSEQLYQLLLMNSAPKNILFIEERDIFRKRKPENSITWLLSKECSERFGLNCGTIYTSCLYGSEVLPRYIQQEISGIIKSNRLIPLGTETEYCDCLHIDDFVNALASLLNTKKEFLCSNPIEIQSAYPFLLRDLMECMKKQFKQATIQPYADNTVWFDYNCFEVKTWTPEHDFLKECSQWAQIAEIDYGHKQKADQNKLVNLILSGFFFLVIFGLAEVYTRFIGTSSELQYVDLRLLLIVAYSIFFGKKHGFISACLCSVASILQALMNGYAWHVLFYHVDNWIPIAIYFITAIIFGGYTKKLEKNC